MNQTFLKLGQGWFSRLMSGVAALLVVVFCCGGAFAQTATLTVPEYFEQTATYEWRTDSFMVNGEASTVAISLEFDEEGKSQELAFSQEYLDGLLSAMKELDYASEIITAPCVFEGTTYKGVYTAYIATKGYGVGIYDFYSPNGSCTVMFIAYNPLFLASGAGDSIVNTLVLEDGYYLTNPVAEATPQGGAVSGQSGGENQSDWVPIVIACVFFPLFFGFLGYLIWEAIYWKRDHGKFPKGAVPNPCAQVANVTHERKSFGKNNTKYLTTVTFTDGYQFKTTKTNRADHFFSYEISVDHALRAKIVENAMAAHQKALVKLGIAVTPESMAMLHELITKVQEPVTKTQEPIAKAQEPVAKAQEPQTTLPEDEDYLEDITFIKEIRAGVFGGWNQYDILFAARGYGWQMMLEWGDYMAGADIAVNQVTAGAMGSQEESFTQAYQQAGSLLKTPELSAERGMLTLAGMSNVLGLPVKIVWINQTRTLRIFSVTPDKELIKKYVETMVRRTFGTPQAMKLGRPLPLEPVTAKENKIFIDSDAFLRWQQQNGTKQFEWTGVIPLTEKEPTLFLYEDGVQTRNYCLQTKAEEDFTGKYFLLSVRLGMMGSPLVPVAQIDGFIADQPTERAMTLQDVGYRFEGHFLACGGLDAQQQYRLLRGQDLPQKGLKYAGYTTPSNVRLLGICPECGKSFVFHGYSFYMAQNDVAYSDDGLDCCQVSAYEITDKENWTFEKDGKTFRYYNSFCCPHCGEPYLDYKKYPENKQFGVSGCVHLGRTHYTAE